MSKELTEQWRNGTLPLNYYYVERKNGAVFIDYTVLYFDERIPFSRFRYEKDIKEVVAPVPTWKEYLESESHCSVYSKLNQWNKDKIDQLEKQLSSISEQLKEAEDVIRFYANTDWLTEEEKQMTAEKYHLIYGLKAIDYLEKYNIS